MATRVQGIASIFLAVVQPGLRLGPMARRSNVSHDDKRGKHKLEGTHAIRGSVFCGLVSFVREVKLEIRRMSKINQGTFIVLRPPCFYSFFSSSFQPRPFLTIAQNDFAHDRARAQSSRSLLFVLEILTILPFIAFSWGHRRCATLGVSPWKRV